VYNAVLWPSRRRWNLDAPLRELGYEPDREARARDGEIEDGEIEDGDNEDGDDEDGAGHLSTCRPERDDAVPTGPAGNGGSGR
jgi:hypothetical protein